MLVVWSKAVESLNAVNRYHLADERAQAFAVVYMKDLIDIMVEQRPTEIGNHERSCVEDCLALAVTIVARDLHIQQFRNCECCLIRVLSLVFNRNKGYYKRGKPEVRLRMIELFRAEGGFEALAAYLESRVLTRTFPTLDLLHPILNAMAAVAPLRVSTPSELKIQGIDEYDTALVGRAVMKYISSMNDETVCTLETRVLHAVRVGLQGIFDRLVSINREECHHFYSFWRDLVLLLLNSKSQVLSLFGWEELEQLIGASRAHRPPPKAFDVSCAGVAFVNGRYTFCGITTPDGYAEKGRGLSYVLRVQSDAKVGAGKVITLFRCATRSQEEWWFFSEVDEEQPGTDRDIDYYKHKIRGQDDLEPPSEGWLVGPHCCGIQPPPRLKSVGLMVPKGQEFNTLEHQLAKWAIENKIVEQIVERMVGVSLSGKAVRQARHFIKFLAQMCTIDETQAGDPVTQPDPNPYCLQKSHLLSAWKTCTNDGIDTPHGLHRLLVSLLPSLPNTLSLPLLQAVQHSLNSSVVEPAIFCTYIVERAQSEAFESELQSAIYDLIWAVLRDPRSSCHLQTYDLLMRYAITCPASAAA